MVGAKCIWISYEGCKSLSFYNPARGEPSPRSPCLAPALSLSPWRDESRVFTEVGASRSIQTHCGVSYVDLRKGRTADEGVKARDIRADMVDRRKMMTLVRYALARKAFRSLFPWSSALSRSLERVSIISHPLSRGSRGHATRQPLHKVRSARVNETPLWCFFCYRSSRPPFRDLPGLWVMDKWSRNSELSRILEL